MEASHRLPQFCLLTRSTSFARTGTVTFLDLAITQVSLCYGPLRSQGMWAELCDHQLVAEWRGVVESLYRARRQPGAGVADLQNAARFQERDSVIFSSFSLCLLAPVGVSSFREGASARAPEVKFPQPKRVQHQTSFRMICWVFRKRHKDF